MRRQRDRRSQIPLYLQRADADIDEPINPTTAQEELKSTTASPVPQASTIPKTESPLAETVAASLGSFDMQYPVVGQKPKITSWFNRQSGAYHGALDMRAPEGSQIAAVADATVLSFAPYNESKGGNRGFITYNIRNKQGDELQIKNVHFQETPGFAEKARQAKISNQPLTLKKGEVFGVTKTNAVAAVPANDYKPSAHLHFGAYSVSNGIQKVSKALNLDALGLEWETKGENVQYKPEDNPGAKSNRVAQPQNSLYNKEGQPTRQASPERVNETSDVNTDPEQVVSATNHYGDSGSPTQAETYDPEGADEETQDWLADVALPLMARDAVKAIDPLYRQVVADMSMWDRTYRFFFGDEYA